MIFLHIFFSVAAPTLMGIIFLRRLGTFNGPESLALGWGFGSGVLSLGMFYGALGGLKFDWVILIFGLVSLLLALKPGQRMGCSVFRANIHKDGIIVMLGKFILTVIVLVIFLKALSGTHSAWDFWSVWAFKAKIYFVERTIPWDRLFNDFPRVWGNWDYPHHFVLVETWFLLCAGVWNEALLRVVASVYMLAMVLLLWGAFLEWIQPIAVVGLVLMVSSFGDLQLMTVGSLVEPCSIFYYLCSLIFVLRWGCSPKREFLIFAGIAAGLAAWTKNEGMAYFLMNGVCLYFISEQRERYKALLIYGACFLMIISPWWGIKTWMGLKNVLINERIMLASWSHWQTYDFGRFLIAMGCWVFSKDGLGLAWGLFILGVVSAKRWHIAREQRVILLSIGMHMMMIFVLSWIDRSDLFLGDALRRLLLSPSILVVLYLAFYFKRDRIAEEEVHPAGIMQVSVRKI